MCFHKSFAKKEQDLLDHYSASFQAIHEEIELVKDKFFTLLAKDQKAGALSLQTPVEIHDLLTLYSQKDALPSHYSKQELAEMKWSFKTLFGFREQGLYR